MAAQLQETLLLHMAAMHATPRAEQPRFCFGVLLCSLDARRALMTAYIKCLVVNLPHNPSSCCHLAFCESGPNMKMPPPCHAHNSPVFALLLCSLGGAVRADDPGCEVPGGQPASQSLGVAVQLQETLLLQLLPCMPHILLSNLASAVVCVAV